MDFARDFITEYFVKPLIEGSGYNIVNTIAYIFILLLLLKPLFLLLKKMKVKIDRHFAFAVFPFALFGSLLRVLEDKYSLTIFLKTPFIYFLVCFAFFASLLVGKAVELLQTRKIKRGKGKKAREATPYFIVVFSIGLLFCLFTLPKFKLVDLIPLFYSLFAFLATFVLSFALGALCDIKLLSKENCLIIAAHMLDFASSAIAVTSYGYEEQHVLARFLLANFGVLAWPVAKLLTLLPLLYLIEKERDKEWRNYLKIVVFILGFSPGTRNALTIALSRA